MPEWLLGVLVPLAGILTGWGTYRVSKDRLDSERMEKERQRQADKLLADRDERRDTLAIHVSSMQGEIEALRAELKELRNEFTMLKDEHTGLQLENRDLRHEVAGLQETVRRRDGTITDLRVELAELREPPKNGHDK